MFAEWIIIGGLLFWGLFGLLSAVLVVSVHNRCESFAFFATGLFIVTCLFVGNLAGVIVANAATIILCAIAYPLIGVAWSFPRWVLFLTDLKRRYSERLINFMKSKGELQKENWKRWAEEISGDPFCDAGMSFDSNLGKVNPPQFYDNKERIAGWIALWPWSMIDALLGDVLTRFFRWIGSLLKRFYQAISDRVFSGM
jgi:hypothetical protein